MRRFIVQRTGLRLGRGTCRRYPHRLGVVLTRPKKRLLKADAEKRAAFVAAYVALLADATATGALLRSVDEGPFRADADPPGEWGLKGAPALVDSGSPGRGEQASSCAAVCPETGAVEVMALGATAVRRPAPPVSSRCALGGPGC